MWQQRLTADAKHRKCAKVVGDVMGNYHPHGDAAIYDALVRLAQPFSLRVPLVDGSGNFGSLDGDPPPPCATPSAGWPPSRRECSRSSASDTVAFRPNYDGTQVRAGRAAGQAAQPADQRRHRHRRGHGHQHPAAQPGRGVQRGCSACWTRWSEMKTLSARELCRPSRAPTFPTGGQIVSTAEEISEIYETGQGAIKLRGTWERGPASRARQDARHHQHSLHASTRRSWSSASPRSSRRARCRCCSTCATCPTDDVRIELELKKDADDQKVLAYLFKHTPLQTNFNVNLTCLVPDRKPRGGSARAARLGQSILWHFLHFRLQVVTRRLEHELRRPREADPHPRRLRDGLRRPRRDHARSSASPKARRTRPRRSWRSSSSTPSRPTPSSS